MLREIPVKNPPPLRRTRSRKVTYEEYLEIAPENRIMEWVDGEIISYMSASIDHQDFVLFLAELIRHFVGAFNLGKVAVAPYEAKLWEGGPAREPDILFVSNDNLAKIAQMRLYGAPDLAVELISRSSVRQDRFKKFGEYEQAGVKEYWLIDPRPRYKHAEFYIAEAQEDGEMIFVAAELDDNNRFHSAILPGFWIDVDWLMENETPDPVACVADILRTHSDLTDDDRAFYEMMYKRYS